MGFFSSLLSIGKRIFTAVTGIGGTPTAQRFGRAAVAGTSRVSRVARAGAGLVAGGAAFGLGTSIFDGGGGGGGVAAGVGGNGETFRRTIVQTIRADDGVIIRELILRGAPHLMQHDLVVAKKVFRLSSKLHQKMPKRTVRTSRLKLLTQQVIENALENRLTPQALACPPRPC